MSESNNLVLERMESALKFASESVAKDQEWAREVKENWEKTILNKEAALRAALSS